MKTFLTLITILLILSLAGNYFQFKEAERQSFYRHQENDRFQVEQKWKLTQISKRDSLISSLLNERKLDSATHAKNQGALKRIISNQKARVIIREVPILEDSIIANQGELISDLENERDTLYLTDNQAIDSLNAQIVGITDLFKDQALRAAEAEGRLEKEKKKRFSVGIQTGAGFKGIDIQVGIQYSLWRF